MNFQIYFAASSNSAYPHQGSNILVNTVSNGSTDYLLKETKRLIRKIRPRHLLQDSGGASLYTAETKQKEILSDPTQPVYGKSKKKINMHPEIHIRSALALQPQTLVSLDFPLQQMKRKSDIENEFAKKLPINIEWAKETSKLWKKHCPHMNLLIPVQAQTMEHFELFMEEIAINDIKHTGISIPSRNIDPQLLVRYLIRLYELNVPWVHLLGSTRLSYMTVLAYFLKHKLFKLISMDSRTWKMSGTKGKYLNPDNLSEYKVSDHSEYISTQLSRKCSCPFCKDFSLDLDKKRMSQILCFHNSWVTVNLAKDLYRNATSLDRLKKYVMKKGTPNQKVEKTIDALRLVDNFLN